MGLLAFLKKYFNFNRKERNGLLVLSGLIVLLVVSAYLVKNKTVNFEIEITPLTFKSEADSSFKKQYTIKNETDYSKESSLFVFDPNDVTEEQAITLGLSKKTAGVLLRYREKGGRFKTKEDFKKIYGVSDKLFTKLSPYILIKSTLTENESTNKSTLLKKTVQTFPFIDLNLADSTELVSLKGIGPALSKRILRYRNSLGGFHSSEQLKEVYGITDSLFVQQQAQLNLNPSSIKKLNLNTIETDELRQHPYFKFIIAQSIINYRKKNGKFSAIDDLKKIGSISDDLLNKIAPYCSF